MDRFVGEVGTGTREMRTTTKKKMRDGKTKRKSEKSGHFSGAKYLNEKISRIQERSYMSKCQDAVRQACRYRIENGDIQSQKESKISQKQIKRR